MTTYYNPREVGGISQGIATCKLLLPWAVGGWRAGNKGLGGRKSSTAGDMVFEKEVPDIIGLWTQVES